MVFRLGAFKLDFSKLLYVFIFFNPFPHTTIVQQTTFNLFSQKIESLYNWMDRLWLKVENICGKRRNCTFFAISSFVTMFSKSRLLQRRQKATIWGKGLKSLCMVIYMYPVLNICSVTSGHFLDKVTTQYYRFIYSDNIESVVMLTRGWVFEP